MYRIAGIICHFYFLLSASAGLWTGALNNKTYIRRSPKRSGKPDREAPRITVPAIEHCSTAANEAELDELLEQIYDPESPMYHQFLSVEEFTERFGPSQADYNAVISFAEKNGLTVTGTSPNRMVVDVEGRVVDIEKAFHVT